MTSTLKARFKDGTAEFPPSLHPADKVCLLCDRLETDFCKDCSGKDKFIPDAEMIEMLKKSRETHRLYEISMDKLKRGEISDGSTASYYELPPEAKQLQDLISFLDMNAQLGEIFRACYRYGRVGHSDKKRDIKKIIFYAQAELERLERLELFPRPTL